MTSEEIALHIKDFLAKGGVIHQIPFLHTTKRGHPDVAAYIRIHRRGYYMDGGQSKTRGLQEELPDYMTVINSSGGDHVHY